MFKSSILKGKYELKIYIDNGIIEVFINDGKYVISNIVYDLKSYVKVNGIEKIEINEMIF
ncbi:sucrose-6-phosphate hydrolase [Clostridium sp. CAG:221]|nr:GH32 C-terminal domain-containing protein [Clostridium sp. CAG:221]CDB15231.1 sucrose-6-phosphate hydrolase [Clostridium sp. CAG:221]